MDQPTEEKLNEEELLKRLNPDLHRIYCAFKVIDTMGGHGSIEIHFVKGKIKLKNGLYIKPGFDYDNLVEKKKGV